MFCYGRKITHEIDLIGGAPDGKGGVHRHVVFGRRITCKDLMRIDTDPQARNPTQYEDLVMREAIVGFGTMKLPVPLTKLLDLDSVDREDLTAAHNGFQRQSLGDRTGEIASATEARLAFGFRVGEVEYPNVEFGLRITGRDEVEADRRGLSPGIARLCFLLGRQIQRSRPPMARVRSTVRLNWKYSKR